jgi:hypothetical protein
LVLFLLVVDNFDSNATINAERPKVFLHPPEEIAEQFLSQPSNFVSFIFTNYPGYFTAIEHCQLAADTLSCVELFLADYRVSSFWKGGFQEEEQSKLTFISE